MATTMISYGLTWTDPDGAPRASAVSYDKPSGEERKQELEKAGATDVELVSVSPGELPNPRT
ncbi:hypothetical protein [Streptomyces sp. NPDC008150]|uniref:hypothetical protein n=1 Tax=Streptomyces sp. NPDC008150 TaxID=3364816 RepID=UPI0036E85900